MCVFGRMIGNISSFVCACHGYFKNIGIATLTTNQLYFYFSPPLEENTKILKYGTSYDYLNVGNKFNT